MAGKALKDESLKMQITVSIFMLAYNQENYISQAIEGVLMQKTNFKTELVIGEDCSTDSTRSICKRYAKLYSDKIKLLLNDRNLGLGANYVRTYYQCTGKYVAICDGDDYWTDPYKLQKQVDFLEANQDFKIVFTNNRNIYPSGNSDTRDLSNIPEISSFEDLIRGNYIASVTVMFKNVELPETMQKWMLDLPYGDWPTYLLVTKDGGKIRFLDVISATYRKDFGTSKALRKKRCRIGEINIFILQNFRSELMSSEKKELLDISISNLKLGLLACYNKEKKYLKSLKLLAALRQKINIFRLFRIYLYSLKRAFLQ